MAYSAPTENARRAGFLFLKACQALSHSVALRSLVACKRRKLRLLLITECLEVDFQSLLARHFEKDVELSCILSRVNFLRQKHDSLKNSAGCTAVDVALTDSYNALPFQDQSFDLIIFVHDNADLTPSLQYLCEFRRCLAHGGSLMLTSPWNPVIVPFHDLASAFQSQLESLEVTYLKDGRMPYELSTELYMRDKKDAARQGEERQGGRKVKVQGGRGNSEDKANRAVEKQFQKEEDEEEAVEEEIDRIESLYYALLILTAIGTANESHTTGGREEEYNEGQRATDTVRRQRIPLPEIVPRAPPGSGRLESFYNFRDIFPELEVLRSKFTDILEEVLAVSSRPWSPWPEKHYGQGSDWKVFPFVHTFPADDPSKTTWIESTSQQCPKTIKILKSLPNLRTALFSRLGPSTTINKHSGWAELSNHVLRCHIGLIVPEGSEGEADGQVSGKKSLCGICVGGEVRWHHKREIIVFDDSLVHFAFNFSRSFRSVLIVDLARPQSIPMGRATGKRTPELDNLIKLFN